MLLLKVQIDLCLEDTKQLMRSTEKQLKIELMLKYFLSLFLGLSK